MGFVSTTSHPFDEYVRRPADEIRLAEAALLYAADEYPKLDPRVHFAFLDQAADRVASMSAPAPMDQVEALRTILVDEERLVGVDLDDYHNPENSYLNRVIERRRGIPITLSAIWLDVAAALGWRMVGIGAPGHFLIRHLDLEDELYIDPFRAGLVHTEAEVRGMLAATLGGADRVNPDALAPVDNLYILRRSLGNLYSCYLGRNDYPRAAVTLRRMVAVVPEEVVLRAELGRVLSLAGQFREAAEVLHAAQRYVLDEDEGRALSDVAQEVKRRMVELN